MASSGGSWHKRKFYSAAAKEKMTAEQRAEIGGNFRSSTDGKESAVAQEIRERYGKDLPTTGALGEQVRSARARLEQMEAERDESDNRYRHYTSDTLNAARQGLSDQVRRLTEYKRGGQWNDTLEAQLKGAQVRLSEANAEASHRREWYDLQRRVAAAVEGKRTGKIVLDKSDARLLLGKPRDAYVDAGMKPRGGRYDYNPGVFVRSDLSGRSMRHYFTLPDGRKAHPDEIHQARTRGRVIVVDQISVPNRDWTKA